MLEMRPNCECCDKDLSPDSDEVWICSLECTFCAACANAVLRGTCPNCGGELLLRPRRAARWLAKYPPSTRRVRKPGGCRKVAPR